MNKPKIRFKGFEGEWKEKALGDVVDEFKYGINAAAVSYDGENKYLRITDIDEGSRAFIKDELASPDADLSSCNEYIMQDGDIVIARTGASVGKSYIYRPIDGKVYFAGFLIRARVNKNVDREFVFQNTLTDGFKKYIRFVSQRSGQPGVNAEELKSYLMNLPASLPEQRAIASYFTALDTQIAASTSRLSSLKQIKAASLLNMFPQKGETVPRVRFKGFQREWKKVKIGDVAPLTGGFAFQSGQFKTSGVPIIRISNILSSGIVGGDFVYYNEFKGDSEFRLYKGDVVIAMSGATTGKVATFEANDFGYQNQRVGKFSRTNLVNYELLSKLVSAPNFQKKIISKLTSSAQPNASSKDIDSIDLVVPEETEEQRVIASYFTTLDAQITLHRERLEKLKQIKAACLEKMFA